MAVKKKDVIVAELLKEFRQQDESCLAPIRSHNDKVNNDTINFTEIGADPAVLVDNTTYPIAVNSRDDENKPVSLKKLDTENTKVTDDELFALTYDKKSSVREQHVKALMRAHLRLGLHSLAPAADAANRPVFKTTGANVGTRKRLKAEDIIAFKTLIDKLEIDLEGRVLTLSPEHVQDILLIDQSFKDRYNSTETGKLITQLYGFKIFESIHTPVYNNTTFAKAAYGAAPAGTDTPSSVFYSTMNAMKAQGSAKMYYRDASEDPENRMSVVGFRMYDIVAPVTDKGIGAIISDINS